MDSDDDIMFYQMIEEETLFDDEDDEENRLVLAVLQAAQAVVEATPKHGWPRKGKTNNKIRFWITRHMLLYDDYFTFRPANNEYDFHQRFRMQMNVFINVVHGVRDYDD